MERGARLPDALVRLHHVSSTADTETDTYAPVLTTSPPDTASHRFPPWAIATTVVFVLLLCLFGLSYQLNLFCFKCFHRYRQRRAHARRYGNGGFPLPSGEELAAMGRALRRGTTTNAAAALCPFDCPFADPAPDIVVYRRAPRSQGGGHRWIPSFPRMYNRVHPEHGRGLFVAPHELRGEVLLHRSSTHSRTSSYVNVEAEEDNAFPRGEDTNVPPSLARTVQTAIATDAPFSAATPDAAATSDAAASVTPTAVWMTAGTPLRSYLTAHLIDPLHHSALHASRTAAASTPAEGGGTSTQRRSGPAITTTTTTGPAPADGVVTVLNNYRAPTHMFFPLAQYCDLRQWHLVDRPEASLGAVQVFSLVSLAATADAARRQSDNGDSAEFDVPSDVLYGAAHYKKKLVSPMPKSHQPAAVEASPTLSVLSLSPSSSGSATPHIRGNRLRANATEDLSGDESVF